MNENNEKTIPEWHNIGKVSVQMICNNSIVPRILCVKFIEGERFYKIFDEHVRMLTETACVNGFAYNAVTASYRLLL